MEDAKAWMDGNRFWYWLTTVSSKRVDWRSLVADEVVNVLPYHFRFCELGGNGLAIILIRRGLALCALQTAVCGSWSFTVLLLSYYCPTTSPILL